MIEHETYKYDSYQSEEHPENFIVLATIAETDDGMEGLYIGGYSNINGKIIPYTIDKHGQHEHEPVSTEQEAEELIVGVHKSTIDNVVKILIG